MKNFFILILVIFLFYSNISKAGNSEQIITNSKYIIIKSDLFFSGKIFFDVIDFIFCQEKEDLGDKKFVVVDDSGNETGTFGIIMKRATSNSIIERFNLKIINNKLSMYPVYKRRNSKL